MLLALWSGFWDWGGNVPPTPDVVSGGGAGGYIGNLENYVGKLKSISRAADSRIYKQVEAVEEIIKTATPEVAKALQPVTTISFDVDTGTVAKEMQRRILLAIQKLDLLIKDAKERESAREAEEEIIILMALV